MTAKERLTRARVQLVLREPFFGRLVLRLDMVEDREAPTAWTDGARIGYSPSFVDSLTDDQVQGLLVHEVMHCANLHPYRRGGRDNRKWNVAADLAINGLILKAGFQLPAGVLYEERFNGEAAERIYSLLPDQAPQGGGSGGQGNPGGDPLDEVRDGGNDKGKGEATAEEWREAVVQAAQAGKLPAGFERLVKRIKRGSVDWRSILRQFLNQVRASDYTWSRPSRRHIAAGLYLPSMRSLECGLGIFAFDTSGSMCEAILNKSWAECVSALEDIKPEAYLLACDAKVQKVEHVEPGDDLPDKLNLPGGGGTDFRPVFNEVERLGCVLSSKIPRKNRLKIPMSPRVFFPSASAA